MSPTPRTVLKTAREKAGQTQRDVARALGVSHVYYGEIERGTRPLPAPRVPELSKILQMEELVLLTMTSAAQGPYDLQSVQAWLMGLAFHGPIRKQDELAFAALAALLFQLVRKGEEDHEQQL